MPTLQEIERQYDEALRRANGKPEVQAEIKVERAQALADFRLRDVAERERALWHRLALQEYPLAAEFPDRVTGDTEDALRESAKALHERMLTAFAKHQRQERVNEIVRAQLESGEQQHGDDDASGSAAN
jgi:hypothetical protein